jgi:carbonic anhydrase
MATLLQEILTNNHEFLANNKYTKEISKYPQKKFALLTCMDTRLVELINKALGIHRGDAKIIQNAGTSLIGEMGETVKSLLLTIYVFDIKEIFIVGHYDCGVALTSSKDILHNMRSRGVSEQQLKLTVPLSRVISAERSQIINVKFLQKQGATVFYGNPLSFSNSYRIKFQ